MMDKNRESLAEFLGRHHGVVTAYWPGRGYSFTRNLMREVRRGLPDVVYAAGFDSWRAEP